MTTNTKAPQISSKEDVRHVELHGKAPRISSKEDVRHVELPESLPVAAYDADADNVSDHYLFYPNTWARWRGMIREAAAEFLGTMVLVLIGDGVTCQVSSQPWYG